MRPRMLQLISQALRPLNPLMRSNSHTSPGLPRIEPQTAPVLTTNDDPRGSTSAVSSSSSAESGEQPAHRNKHNVNFLHRQRRRTVHTGFLKSKTIEPATSSPRSPVTVSASPQRSRAYSAIPTISRPVVTATMSTTSTDSDARTNLQRHSTVDGGFGPPSKDDVRTHTPRNWRIFPFSSRASNSAGLVTPVIPAEPVPRGPRKGEVVVLNYRTLDDHAMRRLEGRSDHRPVIGSYAIYI